MHLPQLPQRAGTHPGMARLDKDDVPSRRGQRLIDRFEILIGCIATGKADLGILNH